MTEPTPKITYAADILIGLAFYYMSSVVVLLGVSFGHDFLKPSRFYSSPHANILDSFFRFDGSHYKSICDSGYHYDPTQRSDVAFFPAYPLLARGLMVVANCSAEWALLLAANVFLAFAFIALYAYTRERFAGLGSPSLPRNVLLAFALLPTTFFFHMAYSEAVFLAAGLGTLLAMQKRQPLLLVALLSGLTTATRPVGIAFLPVFLWYWWQRSASGRAFLVHSLYLAPLACWGLLAYMAYQYEAFGEPLAFAKTQHYWRAYPDAPVEEKAWALVTLEPVWDLFAPSSLRYWVKHEWHDNLEFSLIAANPIYFLGTALLIALGSVKRWLNGCEILLGAGLLLIPYVTRGYDNSMLSMGRFAAAVIPAYLVVGQLFTRLPREATALLASLGGFLLGAYSALFAAGYALY